MKTSDIIKEIDARFASTYKNAAKFSEDPKSKELWEFCRRTINNPILLGNIVFANDMGIPPVKSLLTIYEREFHPDLDFKFTALQSQQMGSLMGFVFKFVLQYSGQKERCAVNRYGVKTATRFENGPELLFTE